MTRQHKQGIYLHFYQYEDVFVGEAMDEDGALIASHVSEPTESSVKYDMGFTSNRKHDRYQAHCPGGYVLYWMGEKTTQLDEDTVE